MSYTRRMSPHPRSEVETGTILARLRIAVAERNPPVVPAAPTVNAGSKYRFRWRQTTSNAYTLLSDVLDGSVLALPPIPFDVPNTRPVTSAPLVSAVVLLLVSDSCTLNTV